MGRRMRNASTVRVRAEPLEIQTEKERCSFKAASSASLAWKYLTEGQPA